MLTVYSPVREISGLASISDQTLSSAAFSVSRATMHLSPITQIAFFTDWVDDPIGVQPQTQSLTSESPGQFKRLQDIKRGLWEREAEQSSAEANMSNCSPHMASATGSLWSSAHNSRTD